MKIDIITLFPEMYKGPFDQSIIARAQKAGIVEIKIHDLRNWGVTERRTVDDRPYGGGVGMILKVDVIDNALNAINAKKGTKDEKVILLDATGKTFTQKVAKDLSTLKRIVLIAGHYEGVDHRVHESLVDEVISIGNFVLTGGEIPSMVLVDSIVRLIPGSLGKDESSMDESFSEEGYLEYPQYTRPEEYKGLKVPEVLLSGDHKKINNWRKR